MKVIRNGDQRAAHMPVYGKRNISSNSALGARLINNTLTQALGMRELYTYTSKHFRAHPYAPSNYYSMYIFFDLPNERSIHVNSVW